MVMNKSKGQMYGFVSHTWNAIKGKCPHDCTYCYMKVFPQGDLRLDEKEFKTDLGENNFIFVGSSCDMFAEDVPEEWIVKTINHCKNYPKNKYLFQSKNPERIWEFKDLIPEGSIVGTTIESDKSYDEMGDAPMIVLRASYMNRLAELDKFELMVTIEPIMDFDVEELSKIIRICKPSWVNIGADSKNHKLKEPSWKKVEALIKELNYFTKIKCKNNLDRLKKNA